MAESSINPYDAPAIHGVSARPVSTTSVAQSWIHDLVTILILLLLAVVAIYCLIGYGCNAWAADAPPGRANPDFDRLVFAATAYGTGFLACIAGGVGVLVWRIGFGLANGIARQRSTRQRSRCIRKRRVQRVA